MPRWLLIVLLILPIPILLVMGYMFSAKITSDIMEIIHQLSHAKGKKIDLRESRKIVLKMGLFDRILFKKYLVAFSEGDDSMTELHFKALDSKKVFSEIKFPSDLNEIIRVKEAI